MKIIQFVPTLESGGVEQGVLEIANALVRDGHESHVVSAGGSKTILSLNYIYPLIFKIKMKNISIINFHILLEF